MYNVRSLLKLDRRLGFAKALKLTTYDIILLTETWLTEDLKSEELFIPSYTLYRSERKLSKHGNSLHGGVLIGFKDNYIQQEIDNSCLSSSLQASCSFVKVTTSIVSVVMCCLYKSPSNSAYRLTNSEIQSLLQLLIEQGPNVMLVGDFNLPTINWTTHSSNDEYEQEFLKTVDTYNLVQMVDFKTTRTNMLDLCLVTNDNIINTVCQDISLPPDYISSDHIPISIELVDKIENNCDTKMKLSYCHCDYEQLNSLIDKNQFNPKCYSNINVMTDECYCWLFSLISKCTKIRTAHRTDLSPWIKPSTSHMMKKLETLRCKENPSPHKLESLKAKRETMQEQDQADYESRIFQGRDTSRIFKYFKSLRRSKLSPILTRNERLETSKEGRAELLCEYFASITETNHEMKTRIHMAILA